MLDNLSLNSKQKKILIIVGVIVAIGIIYFIYNKNEQNEIALNEDILIEEKETSKEESNEENEEEIIVHITGAVKIPGIIKLKQGSRIEDAVEKAGGLTEDADISNVNFAYVLEDGVKITIPSNSELEEKEVITSESGENIIEDTISTSNETKGKTNINKANEEELLNLPGIGTELASRIVTYRQQNGKFSSIEEIKNVSGIGDSKYEKIKDLISIK